MTVAPSVAPSVPDRLPRVLFLANEAPHTAAAGAIFFHRLFRDYPTDRLLVVSNALLPADAGRLACRYATLPLIVDRLNRTRFWPWRPALRALGGPELINLHRVDRALGGFQPDVVVTLMQDSWYYDLAARYARQRGLPLILFIHDVASGFEPVAPWLRDRQRQRDGAVYRQAVQRWCISPGMVDFFQSEFRAGGEVMPPPRSEAPPTQPLGECRRLKRTGRLTLGYAGGLHYGYGEQLLQALPVLRATGTSLEMFCAPPGGKLAGLAAATDVVHFNGYAPTPEEAWRHLIAKCDAVLQPYLDPAGPHELQYRTHFPSKLGDCLSLGLPLLITGPAFASGVSWCLQHPGVALAVTEPGPAALTAALERLRDDADLRVSLATQALAAATAFDASRLRARLHRTLLSAGNRLGTPEPTIL